MATDVSYAMDSPLTSSRWEMSAQGTNQSYTESNSQVLGSREHLPSGPLVTEATLRSVLQEELGKVLSMEQLRSVLQEELGKVLSILQQVYDAEGNKFVAEMIEVSSVSPGTPRDFPAATQRKQPDEFIFDGPLDCNSGVAGFCHETELQTFSFVRKESKDDYSLKSVTSIEDMSPTQRCLPGQSIRDHSRRPSRNSNDSNVSMLGSPVMETIVPTDCKQDANVLQIAQDSCSRGVWCDDATRSEKTHLYKDMKSRSSVSLHTEGNNPRVIPTGSIRRGLKSLSARRDEEVVFTRVSTFRQAASRIVSHHNFDVAVAALIMLNGLLVGVQTDHLARYELEDTPPVFQILEILFCLIFVAELGIRLFAYGRKFFTSTSGRSWNLFDFFVVSAQILEIGLSFIETGLGVSFNLLRVLRLIRVIRLARALRLIADLRTIVSSIASSMKPLFWTGILLFMVVYVVGVYTTQMVLSRKIANREANVPTPESLELYWGSLTRSIISLFQSISGGIDWDQVARPLVDDVSIEMGIMFAAYIGFTTFCMLNVVTGVFIESVMNNARSENQLRTMNNVTQMLNVLDMKKDGGITWEDFKENLERKEMKQFFKTIDVDIEHAQTLFELLDVDHSGCVDADEFMHGCLRLWSPPKGLDLRMILRDVNKVLVELTTLTTSSPNAASSQRLSKTLIAGSSKRKPSR